MEGRADKHRVRNDFFDHISGHIRNARADISLGSNKCSFLTRDIDAYASQQNKRGQRVIADVHRR